MRHSPTSFFLTLLFTLSFAGQHSLAQASVPQQDTLNQVDPQGRKQGYWRIEAPKADKPGYADGQLIEEGRYNAGKRIGTWKRYWPNGKVMSEVNYTAGLPRGEYRIYYPNGRVEEQGTWDLDRNTGSFKRWHPNGKPAQDFLFDQYGLRDGIQKYFHENGQLAVEVSVKQGRENGSLKRFYANGEMEETAMFHDGAMDAATRKTYAPRTPATAALPEANAAPAPAVSAEETTNAVRFRENGPNTLYDKQLRISQTGDFKSGRLYNGRIYRYGGNGVLIRIEVYMEGRYAGNAPITEEDLN